MANQIDWTNLILGLLAGVAFFLYGMDLMSSALNKGAGSKMRSILGSVTRHPIVAFFVGIIVTFAVQSSSASTVMLVTFVQSGLMAFGKTLAVILGAGVGTTITAQIVAFNVQTLAYFMVAFGFLLSFTFKDKELIRYIGEAVMGFGILFVGMILMSSSMEPLRQYPTFIELLKHLENPVLGMLFACFFTAVIQSSTAFLGIVFVLANQGLISLDAGIPLVLGTNIGTCSSALIASIGASTDAKRVSLVNIIFRVVAALIFIFFIPELSHFTSFISETSGAVDPARFIANAHTIYNVASAILFFPFLKQFERLTVFLLPDKPEEKQEQEFSVKHLDPTMTKTPSLAIDLARNEISRMTKNIILMLKPTIEPISGDVSTFKDPDYPNLSLIETILYRERKINFLEREVSKYLIKISQQALNNNQVHEVYALISVAEDLETIGDIISKGIIPQLRKKSITTIDFSKEGVEELTIMHSKACKQLGRLQGALTVLDPELADRIIFKMDNYLSLEDDYRLLHLERLRDQRKETLATHELHSALMDCLKRINVSVGEIARVLKLIKVEKETD